MNVASPSSDASPVLNTPRGLKLWSVIVTILGDLLQEQADPVSGLVLTGLIERMGLQPQAMRVALHRLKRDGWIDSFKKGRVGYYTLSPWPPNRWCKCRMRSMAGPCRRRWIRCWRCSIREQRPRIWTGWKRRATR